MIKKSLSVLIAVMLLRIGTASAQTAVAAAGGEAGTMSFTVGQTFVEATLSDAGSLTPGVQQAYVITTVEVGVPELAAAIEFQAYPNPVTDRLTLSADATDVALRYRLTDATGRTVAYAGITDAQTDIDMANLPTGVYLLRVDDGKNMVKTFKIVKN